MHDSVISAATHPFSGSCDDMKAVIRRLYVHPLGEDRKGESVEETDGVKFSWQVCLVRQRAEINDRATTEH